MSVTCYFTVRLKRYDSEGLTPHSPTPSERPSDSLAALKEMEEGTRYVTRKQRKQNGPSTERQNALSTNQVGHLGPLAARPTNSHCGTTPINAIPANSSPRRITRILPPRQPHGCQYAKPLPQHISRVQVHPRAIQLLFYHLEQLSLALLFKLVSALDIYRGRLSSPLHVRKTGYLRHVVLL